MRAASTNLEQLIRPVADALGYELVGIEYVPRGHALLLRLYIDREGGITLDDCERLSHQVSGVLEVEDPIQSPYTLEVSSPGLDRPLFGAEHFARYVGREARVRTHAPVNGRRNFKGVILEVSGNAVRLVVDGQEFTLDLSNMDKANLVPELD